MSQVQYATTMELRYVYDLCGIDKSTCFIYPDDKKEGEFLKKVRCVHDLPLKVRRVIPLYANSDGTLQ